MPSGCAGADSARIRFRSGIALAQKATQLAVRRNLLSVLVTDGRPEKLTIAFDSQNNLL
jgi:hypothetical protein